MSSVLRRKFLLSVVCGRRKAWTTAELLKQSGFKELVLAEELTELCVDGVVQKVENEQQVTYFFAESFRC